MKSCLSVSDSGKHVRHLGAFAFAAGAVNYSCSQLVCACNAFPTIATEAQCKGCNKVQFFAGETMEACLFMVCIDTKKAQGVRSCLSVFDSSKHLRHLRVLAFAASVVTYNCSQLYCACVVFPTSATEAQCKGI